MSDSLKDLWEKIQEKKYDDSYCFLCGVELTAGNISKEHVIPQWLQRKYNLWNQRIALLNKTFIEYRYLTIPCCRTCNNDNLKPVEDRIKEAVDKGIDAFKALNKMDVFLWLSKILYGIIYKELFLKFDLKEEESVSITEPEFLKIHETLFLFLHGYMGQIVYQDFFPASIFIFKTQSYDKNERDWDFVDNPIYLTIGLRMGNIGIIAVLQDAETHEFLNEQLKENFEIPFHWIQFRELFSKITYSASLLNRTPKYIIGFLSKEKKYLVSQLPLQGLSYKPIFDEWNTSEYAHYLSKYTQIPYGELYFGERGVWTFMTNEKGEPLFIDCKEEHDKK